MMPNLPQLCSENFRMETTVVLPQAFSISDEHELLLIQHLLARLNPQIVAQLVTTGVHVDGGPTVHWGLAYLVRQPLTRRQVVTALEGAGLNVAFAGELAWPDE